MSAPTFIVLPASSNSVQHSDQDTAEIASTIQNALQERAHPAPERPGPIKQILAHQDSLYKYVNWEYPISTLGCYLGALSILFGVHYLPLTQMVLKAGVTILGVVSITEFISRFFSDDSLSTRLRPKEYKRFPESTLNATLRDFHDLIQYAVVQAQRIVFGQDLNKTFAAFLGFTALYWLIQITSPFWLTVIGLTTIFAAPLISSPRVSEFAHDAGARAQDLAKSGIEKGSELAHNASVNTQELAKAGVEKGSELAHDASVNTQDLAKAGVEKGRVFAHDASVNTQELAKAGAEKGTGLAQNASANTQELAKAGVEKGREFAQNGQAKAAELSSKGKQSTADISASARGTASNVSGTTVENIKKLPQMVPGLNASKQPDSDHQQKPVSALSEQSNRQQLNSTADPSVQYPAVGDVRATHGSLNGTYGIPRPVDNLNRKVL